MKYTFCFVIIIYEEKRREEKRRRVLIELMKFINNHKSKAVIK
jgi:hypothetical protein